MLQLYVTKETLNTNIPQDTVRLRTDLCHLHTGRVKEHLAQTRAGAMVMSPREVFDFERTKWIEDQKQGLSKSTTVFWVVGIGCKKG